MTLRGLLQAAAVVTIAVSAAALLPFEHFAVQLFTPFRLQYLVGGVVLLLALVALREPRYAVAMLAVAVLNAWFVVPWYVGERLTGGATELKLLVANVLSTNEDHDSLFALIEAEQPDLLLLMEVSREWEASLARLRASYPARVVEARAGNFGIAMLSRRPFASSALVDSGSGGSPMIMTTLVVDGRTVNIFGVHPMIPLGQDNFDTRNEQLAGIADLLQQAPGSKILAGDLNTTMWDSNYAALENKTWLRNVRHGFGVLPTWPLFMLPAMIPIDHVLVSEDIGVRDVRTGSRIGSDHLPLVVTLAL